MLDRKGESPDDDDSSDDDDGSSEDHEKRVADLVGRCHAFAEFLETGLRMDVPKLENGDVDFATMALAIENLRQQDHPKLAAVKAEQVALDINLPVTWKHKVLPRLASIMMVDVAARKKDPTEDVPELLSRTASQYEPRKSPARAGLADIRSKYRTKGRPSGERSGGF